SEAGVRTQRVVEIAPLCTAIAEGAAGAVLVDAMFAPAEVAVLRDTLHEQPPWSALPLLLIYDTDREDACARFLAIAEQLHPSAPYAGPRRLLEHRSLLASWFRVALGDRRRQYGARAVTTQLDLERHCSLAVLAALPVGILVFDASGRVIKTNAAFQ